MLRYPVRVQRKSYRGANDPITQARIDHFNRVAKMLEDYLNKQIKEQKEEDKKYFYSEMAADLDLEVELVRSILFSLTHADKFFIARKFRPLSSNRQK
jgi:hypothetical protein